MACVHPVEERSQSEFYEYSNVPVGFGLSFSRRKMNCRLPVSQSVSQCVCMAIDDLLSLSQESSLDHTLSQTYETHTLLLHFVKIRFNTLFQVRTDVQRGHFPLGFTTKILFKFSLRPHVYYIPRPKLPVLKCVT